MAAGGSDGSLKFDTKINTDGFRDGTADLLKAAEKLTAVIENLSSRIDKAFTASGSAATSTAKDIDSVAEAARKANAELERMKKEKAATYTGTITNNNDPPPSTLPDDGKRYNLYGEDVDAIIAKNKQLEAAARETATTVQTESAKEEQSIVGLKDSMLYAVEVFKGIPAKITRIFTSIGTAADNAGSKGSKLVDKVDRLKDHLYALEKKGITFGDSDYDKTYGALKRAETALAAYKKSLVGVNSSQKQASKSTKTLGSKLKKTGGEAQKTGKKLTMLSMLGRSVLFSVVFRGLSMISKAFTEGLSSLAKYSDETNKSMSMLMSANTRLKNSFATAFAPLLNVAAPALKSFIDLLSTGVTYAGQFIAALTGKSTFVKAVDVEEDYAESLKDSNEELKKKEKLTLAFDDLIQPQGSNGDAYKPPTPDQMFETIEVENDIRDFAGTVKDIFSDLFTPLKQSWAENGPEVTAAAKAAFDSLENLAGDVGASFLQVWKNEGYGKAITDDVLISVSNLLYTVANLADGFDRAWKSGDIGTSILRHLGDLLLILSGFFRQATEDIKDWSAKLDFEPLLKSFDNLLVKFNPVVQKIGGVVLWLLEKALLPFAKWALENGIPAVLDLIAVGFEVFASVLSALQPLAIWLWDTFLQPLGKWAGDVFIGALKKITDLLLDFSGWIKTHQSDVEDIALAILAFFAAWKVAELVSKIVTMIGHIGNLTSILGGLDLKFAAIVLVIGTIIYLAAQVAKAWDKMTPGEKLATKIIAVAGAIALVVAAVAALAHDYVTLAIAGGIAAIAGISIAGIVMSANSRSNASAYSDEGYRGYNSQLAGNISGYRMPRLATGTVVPPRAGEFAAILGDNNRETEVVSPLSTIEQALDNVMSKYMGAGAGNAKGEAYLVINNNKFAKLVYDLYRNETQRVGVRMITEG